MLSFFPVLATLIAVLLGISVFGFLLIGRRLGRRHDTGDPESGHAGLGAVDGAVFGLLGLLIAFTFSGAAARFDERRLMVVTEVNNLGTAWLRIDLLAAEDQP